MDENTYFTAQVLERTINVVNNDVRNIRNPKLSTFYPAISAPSADEFETRLLESQEFRKDSGLPKISRAEMAAQLSSSGGLTLFLQALQSIGIEAEFDDDLVEEPEVDPVPSLGFRTTFARDQEQKGVTLTTAEIRSRLREIPGLSDRVSTSNPTKHLIETPPPPIADEDSDIQDRLALAQEYVRQWLR